mmetsp:Transcript_21151/g.61518  ORF Transcript_21151/g.61518 Transcript_21151/m.61518 type:complete len:502 (-) Transcript_21151:394-1899(-)|eukprot:CAMPEP_0113534344 /NCGR_PEP_ID=MMETSP0015_2-20120614/5109_1 /TAXON_ID=2838 /ORGANISM="Odontella" /LENGTH=501 /DNA_ID=CAMNT_0000433499 /DNA_START=136 /DNA_END=1641 /DNA_ORIENTATION=- /assembly_acc=CAM_ASM_000160
MSDEKAEPPKLKSEESAALSNGEVGEDASSSVAEAGGDSSCTAAAAAASGSGSAATSSSSLTQAEKILVDMMRRQALPSGGGSSDLPGRGDDQRRGKGKKGSEEERIAHKFWDTQPMQGGESGASSSEDGDAASQQHCPIVPNKKNEELRQEPYNMPKGFEWADVDILDESQRKEVYDLLAQNYVEDDDCMFRFDYSPEFLIWALTPPEFKPAFHLGVRSSKSGRLMAFITGVPATVRAYEEGVPMVEINFLCVHKKLRSKRLAPVLIKEITRRVNHTGVFQAVYTAGVVLPVPVGTCQYFHRSLDPRKLVEIGFSRLHPRMTMARMQKLYKLPAETTTTNLRPMAPDDVPGAHKILVEYLKKFKLAVLFTEEEFAHWLLPREGVVNSYVASDPDTGAITDLCSFYHLPSTIIGNPKHSKLRAAYSFYNVATSVSLVELMRDCLVLAKRESQDVFNALNLMENGEFLEELKFGPGDGKLHYYLYNWACPEMESKDVGIVLL